MSDFTDLIGRTSQDASSRGWPGKFDPLKSVGDAFNSVLGTTGSAIGSVADSVGDFSNMAQDNIFAAQRGAQGLVDSIVGAPSVEPPPIVTSPTASPSASPMPKRKKRSRKASK